MESKILATVGASAITSADVDEFILSLGARGQSYNTPEGRKYVLSQLIDSKLLLLDAKRNLLEAEAEYRARLNKLKDNLLVNYAAEKVLMATPTISDSDAEKYYNDNPEKFVQGESVNASHILVSDEATAKEIYEKIAGGEITFEAAAKQYSSCPSKENGGSLGDFTRGQMVPEFDSAVFSMTVGEITKEPVKTQFGYHLIKLNSKNESTKVPFAEISERIKEMLDEEKKREALESKIRQLKILYPVDIIG